MNGNTGDSQPHLTDADLDFAATHIGGRADALIEAVSAGEWTARGDVARLKRAVDQMRDCGIELRALPGDPERRRACHDATVDVALALIGAAQGEDSAMYREVGGSLQRAG